ncbi:Mitochondrial ATPase complex subunit atp10 [Knufia obscura]|uniref:Mitochondrial ATPase complex subunit atp10 n=2 Tax=Knufia TaxID=430999 RepID=A0AAN8I3M7_9EURO|nr:Mitochondrial ATPase complex subunit atp10 [Knufia obscura]KAK5948516.1 Mitochondrial ATPase complex subunit atp10 [Knufia fluminis]
MAKDILIELLLAAAARPHAGCLRQAQRSVGQIRHYALARPSKDRDGKPRPRPVKAADPLLGPRKPEQVPLAVGIDRNPANRSAISQIPIPKGVKDEKFVPSPLARPLGLQSPPQPGQNSPIDQRTWAEKKADFANYERAVERRQIYLRTFLRPYFQEWKRLDKEYKGKSFVANERLFRKDKALYFPNMWGQTLSKNGQGPDGGYDTTPALRGKISIVGIQSGVWAEEQVDTFLSEKSNPAVEYLLKEHPDKFQRADINVQGDIAKAFLVKLFSGRLRKIIPEDRWDRYFMIKLPRDVRLGLSDDVRDAMGFLNTQVGYVYLLDADCKIRWAGSGHAWKEELESLNGGIRRLIEEADADRKLNNIPRNRLQNILAEDVQVPNPPMAAAA